MVVYLASSQPPYEVAFIACFAVIVIAAICLIVRGARDDRSKSDGEHDGTSGSALEGVRDEKRALGASEGAAKPAALSESASAKPASKPSGKKDSKPASKPTGKKGPKSASAASASASTRIVTSLSPKRKKGAKNKELSPAEAEFKQMLIWEPRAADLRICDCCGAEIKRDVATCPSCGQTNRQKDGLDVL